jgi:hypothetical protein
MAHPDKTKGPAKIRKVFHCPATKGKKGHFVRKFFPGRLNPYEPPFIADVKGYIQ